MCGLASERNLTVDQFIDQWLIQPSSTHLRYFLPPKPSIPQRYGLALLNWAPPPRILRPSRYPDASYDIQQIPWWEVMRVKRPQVRALRDACYTSYHNLEYSPRVRLVSYPGRMAPPDPADDGLSSLRNDSQTTRPSFGASPCTLSTGQPSSTFSFGISCRSSHTTPWNLLMSQNCIPGSPVTMIWSA